MYITMNMKNTFTTKKQRGFSLLEVMIALVIFSIGLIGLAGLQSASMSYNHSAYLRSQATYLAYNILDKMRANPAAAENGNYEIAYADTGTSNACYYNTAGTCNTVQLAQTDIFEWKQAINTLPGGQGQVVASLSSGVRIYTVTMQWTDPASPSNTTLITVRSET